MDANRNIRRRRHLVRSCGESGAARRIYLFMASSVRLGGPPSTFARCVGAAWVMAWLFMTNVYATAPSTLTFGIYGDCYTGHDIHRRLISMVMNYKSDLVFLTGNLVASSKDPEQWKSYDFVTLDMRGQVPVYPVRGPNDVSGSGYLDRFKAPIQSGNRLYYSFDSANCHFTCLDSTSPLSQNSAQYLWLRHDLEEAQKQAEHLFVVLHEGPYPAIPRRAGPDLRELLCPLFIRYGVDAVFSGQENLYYHVRRDGIQYVVTGGGGAPLDSCPTAVSKIPGDTCESVHHILVCQVVGPRVTVTALRDDGTLLDQFTIDRE